MAIDENFTQKDFDKLTGSQILSMCLQFILLQEIHVCVSFPNNKLYSLYTINRNNTHDQPELYYTKINNLCFQYCLLHPDEIPTRQNINCFILNNLEDDEKQQHYHNEIRSFIRKIPAYTAENVCELIEEEFKYLCQDIKVLCYNINRKSEISNTFVTPVQVNIVSSTIYTYIRHTKKLNLPPNRIRKG